MPRKLSPHHEEESSTRGGRLDFRSSDIRPSMNAINMFVVARNASPTPPPLVLGSTFSTRCTLDVRTLVHLYRFFFCKPPSVFFFFILFLNSCPVPGTVQYTTPNKKKKDQDTQAEAYQETKKSWNRYTEDTLERTLSKIRNPSLVRLYLFLNRLACRGYV